MKLLRREAGIELEMALGEYALAMTSLCDTPQTLGRLAEALRTVDERLPPRSEKSCPGGAALAAGAAADG